MHVQKNVFESLMATLMDTPKSKDGLKARKDMVQLKVMEELHPVLEENGKYTLPIASYNLDLQERRALCTFVRGVKVPTRFLAPHDRYDFVVETQNQLEICLPPTFLI
jgi:hypothetical protein